MNIIKKIIKNILFLLDKFIKKENIIIFSSYIDFTDNSFAMYKYLKNNYSNYRFVWLSLNNNIKNKDKIKEIYSVNSFKGRYYFFKAKYVFATHGLYNDFPLNKNRKFINLWHGMPLKAIGNLNSNSEKFKTNYDVIISTSEYFRKIMSKVFDKDIKNVIVSGQPRNDLLFEKTNFFNKMKINKEDYKNIFIWMPTFRNSNGILLQDGKYKENYISVIPFNKIKELNKLLKEKEILLIIKLHPFDILQEHQFEKLSNVIIIKSGDLEEMDEQLYPLLGATDALITDYSSVWIDYEILDKPIFFAMDDYNEYKKTRGLLFEDFTNISPSPIIDSYDKFLEFIITYEKIDLNNKEVTDRYNKYKDNKSCERIAKYLRIDKDEI